MMPRQLLRAKRTRHHIKSQPRIVLEELPAIDARWSSRKKLYPKDWSTRRYNFDFINPVIRTLTLGPCVAEFALANGETQIVGIKWLYIRGACQGVRAAFECGNCGRRCFKLFYYQGRFGCYRCAIASGVRYASQQVSRKGRKYLQGQRLRRFLGEYPGCTTIHKPPFMHRKTYSALLNRLRQIEAKPESRKYKSKRLTERMVKPVSMYQVEVASIANV
jgi:hypothetical protein